MITFVQENAAAALALAGVTLTVTGGALGHLMSARASGRATRVQAKVNEKSNEQGMIDQLQEELRDYRVSAGERSAKQEERLEHLEKSTRRAVSYIHELRDHINQEKGPPAPALPSDLTW